MIREPTSLSDVMAKKAAASEPVEPSDRFATRTLTIRLRTVVHDQLRELASTARRSQHSLLGEALIDLFQKHGKPPIAS